MRNHFLHLTIAVATAAVAVACSGRDNVDNPRKVQSGGDRIQRIALDGCVNEAAGGGDQFVLRDVSEVDSQPQSQAGTAIPRGSWVRLAGGDDLRKYVGKRVKVTGEVRDTGENTIGTSGQSAEMPRTSVANGNAPQIAVERVEESPGSCAALPGDTARPSGARD